MCFGKFFLVRNLLLLCILRLSLSICSCVSIVFYIKQVISPQSITLLHVFWDNNQRHPKISFAFLWAHLSAGSQYTNSCQLHPDVSPLLFLQISSLLSFILPLVPSTWLCDLYYQTSPDSYYSNPQGYAVLPMGCCSPPLFWYCLVILYHQEI